MRPIQSNNQHSLDNRFMLLEQSKRLQKIDQRLNADDDEKMEIDGEEEIEKENFNFQNLNQSELKEAIEKQDLIVFNRFDS
jgi:hypothetical protein